MIPMEAFWGWSIGMVIASALGPVRFLAAFDAIKRPMAKLFPPWTR